MQKLFNVLLDWNVFVYLLRQNGLIFYTEISESYIGYFLSQEYISRLFFKHLSTCEKKKQTTFIFL